ncbi:unnamed protein product [Trichogramma brassicae]|uniref:Uncharacterized protein n=1 Tax=Trichogramma brassicae TaxID=86971 RepID=A0A6H5IF99_9HYME|nr:unnamed protein product [Trichogramma brassicae]
MSDNSQVEIPVEEIDIQDEKQHNFEADKITEVQESLVNTEEVAKDGDPGDEKMADSLEATNHGGRTAEEATIVEAVSQALVEVKIEQEQTAETEIAAAWAAVERKLVSTRARYLDVRAEEKTALAMYDKFVVNFGKEGLEMAGDWAWKTASYKQERDAAWKVVVRRREERETRDFQAAELKKKQIKAEQARKMLEETSAKARAAMLAATRAYEDSIKEVSFAEVATRKPTHSLHGQVYSCSTCGCLGVRRASECPRREMHYFEHHRETCCLQCCLLMVNAYNELLSLASSLGSAAGDVGVLWVLAVVVQAVGCVVSGVPESTRLARCRQAVSSVGGYNGHKHRRASLRLFARCARRLFRVSGAPDDREVVADERHKRLTSYATTWPASTGISGLFTGNVVRCLARSTSSRRSTAPISASLPNSRTRVREAKRPVVPKHGSPKGLEAALRQTRMSSSARGRSRSPLSTAHTRAARSARRRLPGQARALLRL